MLYSSLALLLDWVFMRINLFSTKQLVKLGLLLLLLSPLTSFAQIHQDPPHQASSEWEAHLAPGVKLFEQARFAEAEDFFKRARREAEKFGPQDIRLASVLGYLGAVYVSQGQYAQAEPLYKRAQGIVEKTLGPNDPNVAASLNNWRSRVQHGYRSSPPQWK